MVEFDQLPILAIFDRENLFITPKLGSYEDSLLMGFCCAKKHLLQDGSTYVREQKYTIYKHDYLTVVGGSQRIIL